MSSCWLQAQKHKWKCAQYQIQLCYLHLCIQYHYNAYTQRQNKTLTSAWSLWEAAGWGWSRGKARLKKEKAYQLGFLWADNQRKQQESVDPIVSREATPQGVLLEKRTSSHPGNNKQTLKWWRYLPRDQTKTLVNPLSAPWDALGLGARQV